MRTLLIHKLRAAGRRLPVPRLPGHFDRALLLIPLIGLVATWSFLTQSLPSTDDGMLHMLRLIEVDRLLRHGVFSFRWAPDFAHGYGYPGLNYYMNLPTLLAELWHLAGLSYPQAIAAAMINAFLVSGWGAYLLGRDLLGRKAGLVVATAYIYAPYQFYDSAYRGNLPELWALALVPWVLWAGRQAATRRQWRSIVPCAIVYAALICTHNIYTMIGSPILGLYLLVLWWQGGHSWHEARRLGTMIGLGLALGATFWMPAFFEKGWTRYSPALSDYEAHFLPLGELLSLPPQIDLSLLNPYPPRSLGWGMLILILVGIALRIWETLSARRSAFHGAGSSDPRAGAAEWWFFIIVFLGASFMPLRAAHFVWRAIPPLQMVQMPWRYLGIAALAGSVCAGWTIAHLAKRSTPAGSLASIGAGGAIVLLVATAIPWTYAIPFPQPRDAGVPHIVRWEYKTKLIGGTASNEFLPIWASQVPPDPADPALLTERDPIIDRLDMTSLPDDAEVVRADYGLVRADVTIRTPQAFRARFKQFYFPGWRVTVDEQDVAQIATSPYGLLGFDVPAGEHRITVQPTVTPFRLAGNVITILALLAAGSIVAVDKTRAPASGKWAWSTYWTSMAVLSLLLLGIKEGIIDRTENLFRARRFDGTRVPGVQTETQINFGDTLTLHGHNLPTRPVVAGQPLRVDLYLSARRPVGGDYMAYARLVDDEGRLWSRSDIGTPDSFRPPPSTVIWPTDAYGHWAYLVRTLPGTPPGAYWIEIGLFERGTWRTLNVLDDLGLATGLSTRIGPVQIARSRTPPQIDALEMDLVLLASTPTGLRCLGSKQAGALVHAGDALQIALFWQAAQPIDQAYTVRVDLVNERDQVRLGERLPLGRHEHPTSRWREGEIVRSPHRLRIPATAAPGEYEIEVTVVDTRGRPAGTPFRVGQVTVQPTDRMMVIPDDVQVATGFVLGDRVALRGYDLPGTSASSGGSLPVTLYWEAKREMNVSYKVFVQLVGPSGVLTQADRVPVNWQRPTTGWITGEVIVDAYTLAIPADASHGAYQLIAGMYDEGTLQRLAVQDTSGAAWGDHVVLQEVTLE